MDRMQQIRYVNEFRNVCTYNGIFTTDEQIRQLCKYQDLLIKWNKHINLISRKDEDNLWTKHILHCISLLFKVKIKNNSKVVDIGTGGGLPGIPIKILRPDLTVLLIDATRKKTDAVSEILRDIGISKINIEWGRAEDIGLKPCFNKKFDLVFARAVASISKLVDWSKLFLVEREKSELKIRNERRGRKIIESPALIAYKGGDLTEEIDTIKRQKEVLNVRTIELPINNYESNLICDANKKIVIVNF